MKVSQQIIDFIKSKEKYAAKPYTCSAGRLTIGYGHVIQPDESMKFVTKERAEKILAEDIGKIEEQLAKVMDIPLKQNQYDAIVSLVFNIGVNAFHRSTALKRIKSGDLSLVPDEMRRWDKINVNGKKVVSEGLKQRRQEESKIFLTGEYETC